jgi:hypothetical protein
MSGYDGGNGLIANGAMARTDWLATKGEPPVLIGRAQFPVCGFDPPPPHPMCRLIQGRPETVKSPQYP